MKIKILLLVVSIYLFCGCGSSRYAAKSNTQTMATTEQASQSTADEKAVERTTVKTDIVQDEECTTQIVEFDTTIPADPDTGLYPVKRITMQAKRANTQLQQVATADREISVTLYASRESNEKSNTAIIAEANSGRGLNWLQGTLCLTGFIAILILIIWLFLKWFKR